MPIFVLFLTVSLALYAAMHVYAYRRLASAVTLPAALRRLAFPLLVLLVLAPFAGRALDRMGWLAASRLINLPTYFWMAWLFWFVTIHLAFGLWNRGVQALARLAPGVRRILVRPRPGVAAALILIATGTVWGVREAASPRVREYRVTIPCWLPGTPPVRLVQVSDVHLSVFRGAAWSRSVAHRVAALRPDLLVSTGDLTDSPGADLADQTAEWATLRPPLGQFAILGNHDYYSGWAGAIAFHRQAGFRLLRGETVEVGDGLRLAGLDDPAGSHMGVPCFCAPGLLNALPPAPGRYTILLRHQPIPTPLAPGVLDLQLSGHTHAGQVFPFGAIVKAFYPRLQGWYPMGLARLYVSAGTGTWGPPLRLLAPPEITLFILEPPPRKTP